MDKERSDRRPLALPALMGPVVVVLGVAAMIRVAGPAQVLGFRPGLVIAEAALTLPGLLALAAFRLPLQALALQPIPWRPALLSFVAGGALWAAGLGLLETQSAFWAPPPGYLDTFRRLHEQLRPADPFDAMLSILAIALAPAVCEEVVFRGIVLPSFVRPLGPVGASLASAALFALIHLDNAAGRLSLYRVPFAFVVGLGLAALRLRADALLSPAVAHATLNAITFLAAPLDDTPVGPLPPPPLWQGTALLLGGVGLTLLVLRFFRFARVERDPAQA